MKTFNRSRLFLLVFALYFHAFFMPSTAVGAPFAEYKVKAAFLLKFADFVDWPLDVVGNASDPVRIGVVGSDPFEDLLPEDISPADDGGNFFFKVTRLAPNDEAITKCNLLFFSSSSQNAFAEVRDKIADKPILTIGDGNAFVEQGGMIAFNLEKNRVRFSANLRSFQKAHLHISAQLLQLAEKVLK